LTPLALSSAEKSVTVQTHKKTNKKPVNGIYTPCPLEYVDKKKKRMKYKDHNEIQKPRLALFSCLVTRQVRVVTGNLYSRSELSMILIHELGACVGQTDRQYLGIIYW